MPEEHEENRRSGACVVIVFLLLVFIVYPASLGPFWWLYLAGYLPDDSIAVAGWVYVPLGLASEYVPGVEYVMGWYIEDVWGLRDL